MNTVQRHLLPFALLCCWSAAGQTQYELTLTGTSSTTDSSGKIVTQSINNATFLKRYAHVNGLSSTSNLGLAYHVKGNDLGDTIDVIDRSNGNTLYTVFGLYFGEDFGRLALLSKSGKQLKRLEYVYTDQNSHSLGSALLTTYYFFDSSGKTNNTVVLGQMQFLILPQDTHPDTQVCTATFTTTKPWTFSSH